MMYLLIVYSVRHCMASYWIRKTRLASRITWRRSLRKLDPRGEVAGLAHDRIHAAVELADPHDAVEVADIVVVEDEVAQRRVVADVARERVITCRYAVQ